MKKSPITDDVDYACFVIPSGDVHVSYDVSGVPDSYGRKSPDVDYGDACLVNPSGGLDYHGATVSTIPTGAFSSIGYSKFIKKKWLRSPNTDEVDCAYFVYPSGDISGNYFSYYVTNSYGREDKIAGRGYYLRCVLCEVVW